ncbi:MAG TPA: oligosaccharide flippase family protein, partial [Chitinophagaceae bacterium]|nr:oligosaccharide flippase family protein [Chitinophagaceae bacterium]
MLKRYFLSNLMVVLVLNILIKPVWIFLIDRSVQLELGHQEYGLYSALISLSVIFSILLDFGITNFNNRHIAGNSQEMAMTLPNLMMAKVFFSLIYFGILCCIAYMLHYRGEAMYWLLLAGLIQFLNSFLQFLRSNISGNQHFKTDSFLSVVDKVLMIVVCGYLLWDPFQKHWLNIEHYLLIQAGAYFLAIVLALGIIIHNYTRIHWSHFSFNQMKRFSRQSLPYATLILLMGLYMRSDSLLLERLEGAEQSSIYAEAFRILDALNMLGVLLAGILLPMFTRLISRKMPVDLILRTSTNLIFSLSLVIYAHSLCYPKSIMLLLDPNADAHLPLTYQVLIGAFPAYCIMYIYSTLLTANGNIRLLIRLSVAACVLSLTMNAILIPLLHTLGAATTALTVQWFMAIAS